MKSGLPTRLDNHGRRIVEYIPAVYIPIVAATVSKEKMKLLGLFVSCHFPFYEMVFR